MKFMGSKSRIAKYIVPIIQKYIDDNNIETYIEPFVGGANVIDKIKCKNKIGYDNNEYLIDMWNEIKNGSHRDQLSFNYVLWKNPNINISYLNKYIYDSKYPFWDTSHGKNKMNETITTNFGGTYDIIGCKPIKEKEPVPTKTVVIPTPVKRIFY